MSALRFIFHSFVVGTCLTLVGCNPGETSSVESAKPSQQAEAPSDSAVSEKPTPEKHGQTKYLIDQGRGQAEIVLAPDAARMAKYAAKELQTYLEKMTGVQLPIVEKPSGGGVIPIYVGKSSFTDALHLKTDGLKYGAFIQASGDDWLALLGPDKDFVPIEPWGRVSGRAEAARVDAEFDKITGDKFSNNFNRLHTRFHPELGVWDYDDTGTLNAVYEFLREHGVRWYAPGEIGEVVPKLASIALPAPMNQTFKPDYPLRRISYYHDHLDNLDLDIWNLRLGWNPGGDIVGLTQMSHGMKFVLLRDEMKQAHPEFYALWNGKRATDHRGGQGAPSLNAAGLKDKHLKYVRTVFDHYNEPMVNIDVVDGMGRGSCDLDKHLMTPERGAQGSMSDYIWGYLNDVALQIHQSHPDRMVAGLAYSTYKLPPEKIDMMSPNLAIVECRWRSNMHDPATREEHRKLREAWLKKLPSKMYFTHDYYLHATPERYGLPVYFPRLISEDLKDMKGESMGDNIEVYDHRPDMRETLKYDEFAVNHLNLYVTSQLWWNADQDVNALLEDYYTNYYGPARDAMKAYIEFCEANWPKMSNDPALIQQSLDLLKSAQAAAPADSIYAQRIQRVVDFTTGPMENLITSLSRKRNTEKDYRILEAHQALAKENPIASNPINGLLEPEFWPPVRVASLVPSREGAVRAPATQFQMLRSGDFIYIAIRCTEPDMANLNIPTKENDDPKIFDGDYVSIILETNTHSYYEIAVNPAGAVFDADRSRDDGSAWTSGSTIAVFRGDDHWSVEMRLPIAGDGAKTLDPMVGIDGSKPRDLYPWYFNVGRQRVRGDKIDFLAFSPTGTGDLHQLEAASKLWGK